MSEWTENAFKNYTALAGEKIFILDAEDASNIAYGYSTTDNGAENRKKKDSNGDASWWWLRSPSSYADFTAGIVCDGDVGSDGVSDSRGVSPAFNVNLTSVIFSSLISSEANCYKLTLKDSGLSVSVAGAVTKDADNKVSIPYTITDNSTSAEPTQVSVVVTDGTWTESGWREATKFQYAKLGVNSFGLTGTGTFTLDSSKFSGAWGTDYHVYILTEDVNGEKETDYASTLVEIKAITASAAGYEGTYDGQAHGIVVTVTDPTSGTTVRYGDAAANCTSDTVPTITSVSDSPKTVYYQVSANGYLTATGSAVVKINKAQLTVKAKNKTIAYGEAPANDGVEYSGFVNSETKSVLGGTLLYDYNYSQGGNAGSYTITPKGLTSDNYDISFAEGTLTVKKAAITGGYSVSEKAKSGSSGTVDVSGLKKDGGSYGTLTVSPDSNNIFDGAPSINNGVVSYIIKSDASMGNKSTITVPVTGSTNYEDYNIIVTVTVTNKEIPAVTVSNITTTYTGSAVDASSINGTATSGGQTVAGTWAFKDGAQGLTNVSDSGTKQVVFTPTDTAQYEEVETTLKLAINKANVTGSPRYTAIGSSGKTLKDAGISIGTLSPAGGAVTWDMPYNTTVERGKSYTWTYTPADTGNYNIKTGSVILWPAPSGGESPTPAPAPEPAPTGEPEPAPTGEPTPTGEPEPTAEPLPTPAPDPAADIDPGADPAEGKVAEGEARVSEEGGVKTTEQANTDGSKTVIVEDSNTNTTTVTVTEPDKTVTTQTTTMDASTGYKTETLKTEKENGDFAQKTRETSPDGTVTEKTASLTTETDGSKTATEGTKAADGSATERETNTKQNGDYTQKYYEIDASGKVTLAEETSKTTAADNSTVETRKTSTLTGSAEETVIRNASGAVKNVVTKTTSEAGTEEAAYEGAKGNSLVLTGMSSSGAALVIPKKVDGITAGESYTVSEIAKGAFENNTFESVTLPGSITKVGKNAFSGCGMTELRIEGKVSKNMFAKNSLKNNGTGKKGKGLTITVDSGKAQKALKKQLKKAGAPKAKVNKEKK